MRGLSARIAALLAGWLLGSLPVPVVAQNTTEIGLVGSTVAQPSPGAWLSESLAITLSDGANNWPRMAAELGLSADRMRLDAAYAEVGGPPFSVRLGRFRLPLGRANTVAVGQEALVSRPLLLDLAFGGYVAGTGGLVQLSGAGLSLRAGLADGGNTFFGGGQVGVARAGFQAELPGGAMALDVGASGATNQVTGVAGADLGLTWHVAPDLGFLLGGEILGGAGNWNSGSVLDGAGYGLAAAGWGPLEAAFRLDVGMPGRGDPATRARVQGFAVAYGMRVAPRALLRLELSRRADMPRLFDAMSGDRVLAQLVFALGGPGGADMEEFASWRP